MHNPLDIADLLKDELDERREDGHDVAEIAPKVWAAITHLDGRSRETLLEELEGTERLAEWSYVEPSTLDEILAVLPPAPTVAEPELDTLDEKILGAWLGRCAGCNLGKPFELWSRASIKSYMELADAYPIADYAPKLDPLPPGMSLNPSWTNTTKGRIDGMARDDDTDYTILGLHILETYGFSFGPEEVAREWLELLPFLQIYTAERAAMRNLIHGMPASEAARYRNPYRQWIGAQIRADMWGYVSPGDPESAVQLAFQDASLSHVQNGIYGELWVAALIAIALVETDMVRAVESSISYVPPKSRLAEALKYVVEWHDLGLEWDAARDRMEQRWGELSPVHTVNNAAVVAAALLWGADDFTKTIGLAVSGGWDTDCNGATAGSVFGAMHGVQALPAHWVEPLNDRIRSALFGFDDSKISDLAARTVRLAEANLERRAAQRANEAKEETWSSR